MRSGLLFCTGLVAGLCLALLGVVPPPDAAAPSEVSIGSDVVPVADVDASAQVTTCTPAPLAQRAGQLLLVGLPGVTSPDEALAYEVVDVGVGGVFLNDSNVTDGEQVRALIEDLRAAAPIAPLIATDEESGRVSTFRPLIGSTLPPRTLAATMTPDEVRDYATKLGTDLAEYGVNLDLAPLADLDTGPSGGVIGDRSFSDEAMTAGEYATAFADGLSAAGVAPAVKHFPGHGRARGDVHHDRVTVDVTLEELMAYDVQPFVTAIDADVPVVMLGHVEYDALEPDKPASLSAASYLLLRHLGFDGVAMTDSIGMGAVHRRWDFDEATVAAVAAGADLVLATDGNHARAMRDQLVAAVEAGLLDEARVNEAATRVLELKGVDPTAITCAGEHTAVETQALGAASPG